MSTRDCVYEHIIWYKTRNDGNSPTMQELCIACGIKSKSTISFHLKNLEKAGKIRRKKGRIYVTDGRWGIERWSSSLPQQLRR